MYGCKNRVNKMPSEERRRFYMLQNQKQKTSRNSSIELLRIISMAMIVACHFATHGDFSFDTKSLFIPRLWWDFIEMGGNLEVDIFVLISGYFLITDSGKIFNLKRILKFWEGVKISVSKNL